MISQQFLKTTKQFDLLRENVNSAITGKNKADKIDAVNEHIDNIAKSVLQNYIESSFVLCYKVNGRELIDIWSDRNNAMYYISSYGGYINLNWNKFQEKFKNILDFSRYEPNKNPNFLTYHDD